MKKDYSQHILRSVYLLDVHPDLSNQVPGGHGMGTHLPLEQIL